MTLAEQTEVETTVVNGLIIDEATGEILGVVPHADEPFRVKDQGSAEWVLEKIFTEESEWEALEARKRMLIENVERMQADHERRFKWLRARFSAELEAWTRSELDGKKTRTIKTPWGSLSLRRTKARLKVDDETRALAWCRDNFPAAIKRVESVLVSQLSPEVDDVAPPGFVIEPARDRFSVDCAR